MSSSWSADSWSQVLSRLADDRVVPFLGAGTAYGVLPTGGELARSWAQEYGYHFGNEGNLVEVAQYLAVRFDPLFPKEQVHKRFAAVSAPDFDDESEPHHVLAEFPLSLYLTTNYDDFMFRALERHTFRNPRRDFLRWNESLDEWDAGIPEGYQPTPGAPLVFHLHGMIALQKEPVDPVTLHSMVLTEDDYIRFLASRRDVLPPAVKRALMTKSCLFIGYRLADWNLRVILETLRGGLGTKNFLVIPPPGGTEDEREAAREYFDKYYGQALDITVYWGTAEEFFREVKARQSANA